ncbi:MAG: hypothetical protein E7289_09785 [Lachnospiraceae bacterium]|nr:hypothetical protein [Lachnospiraceae bacterium]
MKLKIYDIFKQRSVRSVDRILCMILWGAIFWMCMIISYDKYASPISLFVKPTEIKAGTDLSRYYKKQVTCEIPYVLGHVVNFYDGDLYDEDDEVVEYYTHGYIGLDENLENPFFFFVPPNKSAEVEKMMEKTREIYFGRDYKRNIGTIRVTGYVRMSAEKHLKFYEKALIKNYGNTTLLSENERDVYVLDDGNVAFGDAATLPMKFKVFVFFVLSVCGLYSLYVALGWKNRVQIKKYINKYRVDEYQLNQEFLKAKEIAHNYWIGDNYTFYLMGKVPYMILNREIVLVYESPCADAARSSINFHTLNGTRYSLMKDAGEIRALLEYYEEKFPRVVIGIDEEIHRLLLTDFDAFLEIKYRKN